MGIKPTADQARAVKARGKVIVSASAGSGKTRVMVERFVELVAETGADILGMLAVTFTNQAAAQMRERIRRALTEAVGKAEGARRDRIKTAIRQLPLAEICTIHAFCGRLIRTHFYLADVDPAFRIVDPEDAEGRALSARALDKAFENAYENDPAFSELLAVYFRKKNDKRLRKVVLRLYGAVRGEPNYRETLSEIAAGGEDLFSKAENDIAEEYRKRARSVADRLEALRGDEELLPVKGKPSRAGAYFQSIETIARSVAQCEGGVFEMKRLIVDLPSKPRKTVNTTAAFDRITERIKSLAETLKKIFDELKAYHVREEEFERYQAARKNASLLAALALSYDGEFTAAKRDAGVLDYADLEHLALRILEGPEGASVRARYRYLFVDEYQDVNPMQEKILSALAGERCDVFLVGDKKQAIYGFRGSRSRFFEEKRNTFARAGEVVELKDNFRSARAILEAVNTVFSAVLREDYAPMGREEDSELYRFPTGEEFRGEVFLHRLPEEAREEKERGVYSVKDAAASSPENAIAAKVLQIVEEECGREHGLGREFFDTELKAPGGSKGGMRPVDYGDVAVLVRKNTKAAAVISSLLTGRGIPVTSSAEVNVCEQFEARLLLDWLSFLDNPEQDIPMAAAMLSDLGGFRENELARIRLFADKTSRSLTFRAACRLYLVQTKGTQDGLARKLRDFYAKAEKYRALMCVKSAAEMLRLLLADGLEVQIVAKDRSGSDLRIAHVRRLIAESEGCASVHDFLRRLKDCDYEVDYAETGGEDAVHIMTLHAAKGLEFPVVILTELDEKFHGPDSDDVMWTDEYRLAPRYFDKEARKYGDTLVRRAAALAMRRDEIEGERNLLYVGMTRARARLHMLFSTSVWRRARLHMLVEKSVQGGEDYAPEHARKLSDFLPPAFLNYKMKERETRVGAELSRKLLFRFDQKHVEKIRAAGRPYPFAASTHVPVKSSATDLLARDAAPMYRPYETEDDGTMSEENLFDADMGGSFTPEEGTAYHAFLEHVDFSKFTGEMTEGEAEEALAQELLRMQDEGALSEVESSLLDDLSTLTELMRYSIIKNQIIKNQGEKVFRRLQGTAYHAFLQHVDFSKTAEEELTRMRREGSLPAELLDLLQVPHLAKILSLPVFEDLRGKRLWREQKFLVLLPASLFPERFREADDEIVFQGAIDLLIGRGDGKYTVVDYKLSGRSDAELKEHYAVQLKLYRAAVAKVMGCGMEDVDAFIVNIARGRVIPMSA